MSLSRFDFSPRWRPVVEIGAGDTRTPTGAAVWGQSTWGDPLSTWNGGEPIWQDVSCYVHGVEIDTGRDWSIDRFTPGLVTVTADNATGWATAATDPATTKRPGRQLRITIVETATGAVLPLWRGFIDARTPTFTGSDPDRVQFHAIDALGELGLYRRATPYGAPVGAGEYGDDRFARLLADRQWPATWVGAVDASGVQMAGRLFDQAWADEMGITADSEGGAIVCDLAGKIVFRSRDWATWPTGTPPAVGIGNSPGDLCPTSVEVTFDRADLANQISYSREATDATTPPTTTVTDAASQAMFGVIPLERSDLICAIDGQVAILARRALRVKSPGGDRVRAATLDAATDPDAIVPFLLGADLSLSPPIRAQIHVTRDTVRYDQLSVLQRVSHSISSADWTCRLGFDLAAPYVAAAGRWGSATWDLDAWSSAAAATREDVAP